MKSILQTAINADIMSTTACIMARVSTSLQNPDQQLSSLESYCELRGFEVVHRISSVITGFTDNQKRKDIKELLKVAKEKRFDKLVVTEVSRIGRRPAEIRKTLDALHSLGISVVFKQLGVESLNEEGKETFISNLIIAIYSEMAQHEREMLSQRIKQGLAHARKRGRHPGRPPGFKETPEEIVNKYKKLVKDLHAGLSLRKCQKVHGISRTTIVKVRKAMKAVDSKEKALA